MDKEARHCWKLLGQNFKADCIMHVGVGEPEIWEKFRNLKIKVQAA